MIPKCPLEISNPDPWRNFFFSLHHMGGKYRQIHYTSESFILFNECPIIFKCVPIFGSHCLIFKDQNSFVFSFVYFLVFPAMMND